MACLAIISDSIELAPVFGLRSLSRKLTREVFTLKVFLNRRDVIIQKFLVEVLIRLLEVLLLVLTLTFGQCLVFLLEHLVCLLAGIGQGH